MTDKLPGLRLSGRFIAVWLAEFALLLAAFNAHALPVVDPAFGVNGFTRIGVPDGAEDTPSAFALQGDGKLLVAGWTAGRQSHAFVLRLTAAGGLDPGFGNGGVVLFDPPAPYLWFTIGQIAQRPDGSVLLGGAVYDGTLLARLTPDGAFDASFGAGGFFYLAGGSSIPARFIQQADGAILLVSEAGHGAQLALRLVRLTAAGAPDTAFAPAGEKITGGLPADFTLNFYSGNTSQLIVAAQADGGFTALARATFNGGTYLLLRMTPSGELDPQFGSGGLVSGYDVGRPFDRPARLVRAGDGSLLLLGDGSDNSENQARTGRVALWRLSAAGLIDRSFGTDGRVAVGSADEDSYASTFELASLTDGGVGVVDSASYSAAARGRVRVLRLNRLGQSDPGFGAAGQTSLALAGYARVTALGILPSDGGVLIPALAALTFTCTAICVSRGQDLAVASLDQAGRMRSTYGRGDGFAVWNMPAFSSEDIGAMLVESSGNILLAATSLAAGTLDHVVSRFDAGGTIDLTYGEQGRVALGRTGRCTGSLRAVKLPDGATVVAQGGAEGGLCSVMRVSAFRLNQRGQLDAGFRPDFAAPDNSLEIALGVSADGGLLYGVVSVDYAAGQSLAVLQKIRPDGSPDAGFGVNGRQVFPLTTGSGYGSRSVGLTVLDDGAIVFGVLMADRLVLYKVDASGRPVAAFGVDGQFTYAPELNADGSLYGPFSLFALADGSLLAMVRGVDSSGLPILPREWLLALRVSKKGSLKTVSTLFSENIYLDWRATALPDASVLIARNRSDGRTASADLFRLLPDHTLDAGLGAGGAFALPGWVRALALDAGGRLLLAAEDVAGTILTRYLLSPPVVSAPAVEYFNTGLRHYFITAGPGEIAAVESGGAGPGWQRTGLGLRVYLPESGLPMLFAPVCRFYGTPGRGPNSHFYTVDVAECARVKQDPGWTYEGIAFYLSAPLNGQCADGLQPVYRIYNNRFALNDSNHRYTADPAVYAQMQAEGWLPEGIAFCAPLK